jgi:hypothetical protein
MGGETSGVELVTKSLDLMVKCESYASSCLSPIRPFSLG